MSAPPKSASSSANADSDRTVERRRPRSGKPVGVGLLGCGTVGGGVLKLLADNAKYLGERVGVPIEVRRILVRDLDRPRVPECDRATLTTNPEDVLTDPEVELVVEVMGGEDLAGQLVERALAAGKGVVTANKALLAARGPALVDLAVKHRVDLAFEGAVGGGIPIIRTLRDALASDWVQTFTGIMNGTSNYVLTKMNDEGTTFDDALAEAQRLGYAEADPSLDVGGGDAAHKLVVSAMLAFGARVEPGAVSTEGIRELSPEDHQFADRFGYVIKHLAIGRDCGDEIELRAHSTLIPKTSVLANVSGVLNAILLEGRALGPCLVSGPGAGDLPTAVSVVSDILDVARSIVAQVAGLSTRAIAMEPRPIKSMNDIECRYYLRFTVKDQPGVMASLAGALGDAGVSIEQMIQEGLPSDVEPVDVVMITHVAKEGAVRTALRALEDTSFQTRPPRLLRIEDV